MRQLAVCLVLLAATASVPKQAPSASYARALDTALDRHVAAPDSHFSFTPIADLPAAVARGTPRPSLNWTFEDDGTIRARSKDLPRAVTLWQATNPRARDFRIDTIGAAYTSSPLTPVGPNTWAARVTPPATGWTAAFVELTFDTGGRVPLKLTTAVRVLPDTLPFPAPISKRHAPATAQRP